MENEILKLKNLDECYIFGLSFTDFEWVNELTEEAVEKIKEYSYIDVVIVNKDTAHQHEIITVPDRALDVCAYDSDKIFTLENTVYGLIGYKVDIESKTLSVSYIKYDGTGYPLFTIDSHVVYIDAHDGRMVFYINAILYKLRGTELVRHVPVDDESLLLLRVYGYKANLDRLPIEYDTPECLDMFKQTYGDVHHSFLSVLGRLDIVTKHPYDDNFMVGYRVDTEHSYLEVYLLGKDTLELLQATRIDRGIPKIDNGVLTFCKDGQDAKVVFTDINTLEIEYLDLDNTGVHNIRTHLRRK